MVHLVKLDKEGKETDELREVSKKEADSILLYERTKGFKNWSLKQTKNEGNKRADKIKEADTKDPKSLRASK